jgi:hypothetical protein
MSGHPISALASTIDAQPSSDVACRHRQNMLPTVLIASGDATCCQIISDAAEARGCIPVQAQGHEHAASLLRQQILDCVTLDLSSDSHNGDLFDVIWKYDAKLPVFVVSDAAGGSRCQAIERARRYGLNIYPALTKPLVMADLLLAFTYVRLLTVIRGVRQRRSLQQALE